jgi:hypothetical protein
MPTIETDTLTRALVAAAEAFLASLRDVDSSEISMPVPSPASDITWSPAAGAPISFDPLADPLPIEATPDKSADPRFQRMCSLVYLGSIARFYAETGQGAGAEEIRRFALKAGYANGRAVNGWNSRAGSIRGVEVIDGLRYINQNSAGWLSDLESQLGIQLRGAIRFVHVDDEGTATID